MFILVNVPLNSMVLYCKVVLNVVVFIPCYMIYGSSKKYCGVENFVFLFSLLTEWHWHVFWYLLNDMDTCKNASQKRFSNILPIHHLYGMKWNKNLLKGYKYVSPKTSSIEVFGHAFDGCTTYWKCTLFDVYHSNEISFITLGQKLDAILLLHST